MTSLSPHKGDHKLDYMNFNIAAPTKKLALRESDNGSSIKVSNPQTPFILHNQNTYYQIQTNNQIEFEKHILKLSPMLCNYIYLHQNSNIIQTSSLNS